MTIRADTAPAIVRERRGVDELYASGQPNHQEDDLDEAKSPTKRTRVVMDFLLQQTREIATLPEQGAEVLT